jgi:hypothetical protein
MKKVKSGQATITINSEVLGITEKEGVFIQAYLYTGDGESEDDIDDDVILLITEEQYINYIKEWMIEKKNYCERYSYFCGVDGHGLFLGEFPEIIRGNDIVYDGRKCEMDGIDMEHG